MFSANQTIQADVNKLFFDFLYKGNDERSAQALEEFIKKYPDIAKDQLASVNFPFIFEKNGVRRADTFDLVTHASYSNQPKLLRGLVALGLDVNSKIKSPEPVFNGLSALMIACDRDHIEIAKTLLECNVDIM